MPELYDMPDRYSRVHPSARSGMADVEMEQELVRLRLQRQTVLAFIEQAEADGYNVVPADKLRRAIEADR